MTMIKWLREPVSAPRIIHICTLIMAADIALGAIDRVINR